MSTTENAPKPRPPVKKQATVAVNKKPEPKKEEKKPFVRKEHLTQRPFSDSDLFRRLREQTQPDAPKNPRRKNTRKETSK